MEEEEELEGIPSVGDVVLGKYRVDRVLGVGGMGCVVAAQHMTLGQPVAIKFLLAKAAKNPKNITRFEREAQAAATIKSDHVAKVSDIGRLDDGSPYMVMEYLDGCDLAERIERYGALPVAEAVTYLLQACEALAEAHQAGIVHRDLKPANLFLARMADGTARVKVLDFGISKLTTGSGQDLTKTSALMGSPLYMSPEQMMSAKSADHRTDIWALGCIVFELLGGRPPFMGETLPEICSKILAAPPIPLVDLAPHVPPQLRAVIERCLTKEPEGRFPNLGELAIALAPFAGPEAQQSLRRISAVLGLSIPAAPTQQGFQVPAQAPGPSVGSHPAGAQTSSPQVVVQPATSSGLTAYPEGTGDGAHTHPGGPPSTVTAESASFSPPATGEGSSTRPSHPHTVAMPAPPAHAASTAAPVAQTMTEEPAKGRGPLVALAAVALFAVAGVGLWFGAGGSDDAPAATIPIEPSGDDAATQVEPEPAPDAPSEDDAAPDEVASAAPSASTEAPVAGRPVPPPTATESEPRPPAPPPSPPVVRPPPPPAVHVPKPGDDAFN